MPVSVEVYSDRQMSSKFSEDGTYLVPITHGSIAGPLNGLAGDVGEPVPIWIKNTGTTKLTSVVVSAADGLLSAQGGFASSSADALVEFALDNGSNYPNEQAVSPSSYLSSSTPYEGIEVIISNVFSDSGPKSFTNPGDEDDARTMMPGEYAILWVRSSVDDVRSPGGSLPFPAGIHNINLKVQAISRELYLKGAMPMPATILVRVYGYQDLNSEIFIGAIVAYWKFDEGMGLTAYDSHDGNHGAVNSAVWWNIGIDGTSLQFDGASNVDCGDNFKLDAETHDITLSAWFKAPLDFPTPSGVIAGKKDGAGYEMRLEDNGEVAILLEDDLGNTVYFSDGEYLDDTGWHMATFTMDRETDLGKLYIDAVQVGSDIDVSSLTGSIETSTNFFIGGGSPKFVGRIDEVEYYSRVLSSDEIQTKYDDLWSVYVGIYGITDGGELVTDNNGRVVVDEIY